MNKDNHQSPSLGLCLSGGGARGFAHIGVLRIFEREGIPIKVLSGTSMGGVIAAGYGAGMDTHDIEKVALRVTNKKHLFHLIDPTFPNNGGLIRGQQVFELFRELFGDRTFSELPHQVAVVAVDLNSHREIVLNEGSVALALRATTSIPGVFTPVELDNWRLVDGGVLNNLPIDVTYNMGADIVIAVDISLSCEGSLGQWIIKHTFIPGSVTSMVDVFDGSLYALRMKMQENMIQKNPPALLICPELPANVNTFLGYHRVSELIEAGANTTERMLPQIKFLLDHHLLANRPSTNTFRFNS